MAPPAYNDLGRSAKDIFSGGYNFNVIKLDLKTRTPGGVEFTSGGVSHLESGKVVGTLETKYKFKEYGVTFSEKWNTSNILATEVSVQDVVKGSKFGAETTFAPQTGDKSVKVKTDFLHDICAFKCEADFKSPIPVITSSVVFGYRGWLCGYQMKFDTKDSKLKNNNLAVGFSSRDFVLHTNVNDGKQFGGSIYQKVSPILETGVDLAWSSENNDTKFGLGCKYVLDKNASVKAKVNNNSEIGLAYSQKIRDGVTVSLSTLIDGKNLNQGGHKIGLGLEFEA